MKKATLFAGALAILATSFLTSLASAVPFDNKPKLLLHLRPTTTKNQCVNPGWGSLSDCTTASVNGTVAPGGPYYYCYILVARGEIVNVAGVEMGLMYQNGQAGDVNDLQGIDIFSWSLCATLEFITTNTGNVWPAPGGGNLITWNSLTVCQTGETGVVGYFYMGAYTPDKLSLTPRPVSGLATVADCASIETALSAQDLGFVQFSADASVPGCNPCNEPCIPVPVKQLTWGGIKSLY